MDIKDFKLLLVDLSGRIPYHLAVHCTDDDEPKVGFDCFMTYDMLQSFKTRTNFYQYMPYLRKLSDMTEIEYEELKGFDAMLCFDSNNKLYDIVMPSPFDNYCKLIDWFNAHHFDYRGLIEKGLAIAVDDKGFNPYKKQ